MNEFYKEDLKPPYKKESKQYNVIVDSIVKLRTRFSSKDLYKTANRKLDKGEKLEWNKMQGTLGVLIKANLIYYQIDDNYKIYLELTSKNTVK